MLAAFLTESGGRVLIPDAVALTSGDTEDEVRFVDAAGKTLVVFRRQDIIIYSRDAHV